MSRPIEEEAKDALFRLCPAETYGEHPDACTIWEALDELATLRTALAAGRDREAKLVEALRFASIALHVHGDSGAAAKLEAFALVQPAKEEFHNG